VPSSLPIWLAHRYILRTLPFLLLHLEGYCDMFFTCLHPTVFIWHIFSPILLVLTQPVAILRRASRLTAATPFVTADFQNQVPVCVPSLYLLLMMLMMTFLSLIFCFFLIFFYFQRADGRPNTSSAANASDAIFVKVYMDLIFCCVSHFVYLIMKSPYILLSLFSLRTFGTAIRNTTQMCPRQETPTPVFPIKSLAALIGPGIKRLRRIVVRARVLIQCRTMLFETYLSVSRSKQHVHSISIFSISRIRNRAHTYVRYTNKCINTQVYI
jgi:hypothetical protein